MITIHELKMKHLFNHSTLIIVLLFMSCSSTQPSLCDCLTTPGDLPSGCEQVLKDRYGVNPMTDTNPEVTNKMETDYYNCK